MDSALPPRPGVKLGPALSVLGRAELVRQLLEQEPAYQFRHALVQDTAYQSLLKHERRELHLAAARVLEASAQGSPDDIAAILADHYHRAGDAENTIRYARRAGEHALTLYAHSEAKHFFGMALEYMAQREPSSENTRAYLDLALDYYFVSWARGATDADIQELRALVARARTLAEGPDSTDADRVRAMRVVAELGNAQFARNEVRDALECYQEILAATTGGVYDATAVANASINTAGVLTVQGYFDKAEPLAHQGYEIGKEMPLYWYWYGALTFASLSCAARGNPHQALKDMTRGLEEADAATNLPAGAALAVARVPIYRMMRDWQRVLAAGEDAYARAARSGDSLYQHLALSFCAQATSELGQMERARELLEQARTLFEANEGQLFFADWTLATFASTLLNLGEFERARQEAEQLIAVAPVFGNIYSEGLARRVRARLLSRVSPDETQAIEEDLNACLELFGRGDARLDIAHTHAAWGAILNARGDADAAREHWRLAAAQYRTSGLDTLAEQAEKNG